MTVRDLLTDSLKELGVVALNQTPLPEDLFLMLHKFNLFIDDLNADKLSLYEVKRSLYSLVALTASYTVGPSGVWNGNRPEEIIRAGFVDTIANPTDPLETDIRVLTDEEWAAESLKTMQSNLVTALWYQKDFPLGIVYVWPISIVAAKVALYHKELLSEVAETTAGLDTVLSLPPGYRRMLVTNLSVDAADVFEKDVSASLVAKAMQSMNRIKRANIRPGILQIPSRLLHRTLGYRIMQNG